MTPALSSDTARAQCLLVLLSATPQVSLKSCYKLLSTSQYHSFPAVLKAGREEPSFPLGSCPGPADGAEPLLYIAVSAEAAQGGLIFFLSEFTS